MSQLFNTEISEVIKEKGIISNWANKVENGIILSAEEKEISQLMDVFAKEIGNKGKDNDCVIAEFIKKVIEPEVYNPNDEILGQMFNMGSIGEFDEKVYNVLPKNTIKVYDAVRGGNVPKSYLDPSVASIQTFGLQSEVEIKFSDLRKNGFKSIASLTAMAEESMNNEKYFRLFTAVDNALTASGVDDIQDISAGGTSLTVTAMDLLASYLNDRGTNGIAVGLSKYTNGIARMSGFEKYLSEDMKNEFNKYGRLGLYDGIKINGISSARKTADNKALLPDKRIFGIADKIGDMDMVGELRVLEETNINTEKVHLKLTGFNVNYVIYMLDKIARITLS